ncbi:hypothetical protein CAPTEDRAFT_211693 [Capitella teleta]|uniref:Uncharacterized protein n=1 Tax=Capitella teleta TaxID=283909 RepID=R7UWA9_CAPTE|nr:hypothetical protein CAPTEDRAFT_211693 [Capitella teleta]|eukprot:ELU07651.1 hypothetical protein CAPTEDRAFT_211693 [Capitella teleta]
MHRPMSCDSPASLTKVVRGFVYIQPSWPRTLQKCPESVLNLVDTSTKPNDIKNDFGHQEERPLAEHYYKHGGAESTITMMQRRNRNPRAMSARHDILNLKSPRCFANSENNFEVLRAKEIPRFLLRRGSSFVHRQESTTSGNSDSPPRLERAHTFPTRMKRKAQTLIYFYVLNLEY